MGQARLKQLRAGAPVTFDFGAPKVVLNARDQEFLASLFGAKANKGTGDARAIKHLVNTMAQAAFPGGMDRGDRRTWAGWLEAIESPDTTAKVTRGMVEWLQRLDGDDKGLKLPGGVAQWAEALHDYLDELLAKAPAGDAAG